MLTLEAAATGAALGSSATFWSTDFEGFAASQPTHSEAYARLVAVFYGDQLGLRLRPHDLRSCAKLCRTAGAAIRAEFRHLYRAASG